MGYILLASQLQAIESITNQKRVDSITLLWMPGYVKVTVWEKTGIYSDYRVDEDGRVIDEPKSNNAGD